MSTAVTKNFGRSKIGDGCNERHDIDDERRSTTIEAKKNFGRSKIEDGCTERHDIDDERQSATIEALHCSESEGDHEEEVARHVSRETTRGDDSRHETPNNDDTARLRTDRGEITNESVKSKQTVWSEFDGSHRRDDLHTGELIRKVSHQAQQYLTPLVSSPENYKGDGENRARNLGD